MTNLMPQSPPEPWSELLAGYVLGDLNHTEIATVEQYLTQHPEQQAAVSSLMLPLDLLSLSLPVALPAEALRERIMQIAADETVVQTFIQAAPLPQPVITSPPSQLWRFSKADTARTVLAALGLLIGAGFGWQNYQLSQELATVKQYLADTKVAQIAPPLVSLLQQPHNRFMALNSMGNKAMGMGSLVIVPQKSVAVLTLQQVPPVPPGQVYRLWAIMGDQEMACGDFLPDAAGRVLMQISLNRWEKAHKVMITIEDKAAVQAEGEIAIEGESQI
jgi:hypothetical protein